MINETVTDEQEEQTTTKYVCAICDYCDTAGLRKIKDIDKPRNRLVRTQYKCKDKHCIEDGLDKPTHARKGGGERPPKGHKWKDSINHTTLINKWGLKNIFPPNNTGFENKKDALEMVEFYNSQMSTANQMRGEEE